MVPPLMPRLVIDDMLKQAAIAGLGVLALPGYVCRDDVKSGALRRVLPEWIAATLTALIPYRQGLQGRLGHASIQMTADRYEHLFPRGDDSAELAAAERAFLGS